MRPPALDEQLCFALYGASMAVGRAYKPQLDALGITYPQYLVLSALWEVDGRNVGEIADRLSLEPSTVTPLVKRLVTAGLVTRERNPDDERQVLVRLTEEGQAMRDRTGCLAETLLAASGMSVEALSRLARDVRTLRDAVAAGSAQE
jgi:DNA-binding MarR family transcriptional regulator